MVLDSPQNHKLEGYIAVALKNVLVDQTLEVMIAFVKVIVTRHKISFGQM